MNNSGEHSLHFHNLLVNLYASYQDGFLMMGDNTIDLGSDCIV